MASVLPHDKQYESMVGLMRALPRLPDEVERFLYIASYAALVGKISERTLINLMEYAEVDFNARKFLELLRLYFSLGMIELSTKELGLYKRVMVPISRPYTKEQLSQVKTNLEKIRKKMMGE